MDGTYMPVLNQLLAGQDEAESQQLIHEFREMELYYFSTHRCRSMPLLAFWMWKQMMPITN